MNLELARQHMITQQIRSWDVTDPEILNCLARVPREHFVPEEFVTLAFADTSIPLGHGQTMLKPVVEGRLLQALNLQPNNRVLVVGTGSGYLTACIARLATHVTSLEIVPELHHKAHEHLRDARVTNVDLQAIDFQDFQPTQSFDRIFVTGSMPEFDARFAEWLTTDQDNACLMIVGLAPAMSVERINRNENHYTREKLFETVVPPLQNLPATDAFRF